MPAARAVSPPARLALVVPGLLPHAPLRTLECIAPAPSLERVLARAQRLPFAGDAGAEIVLRLFDYPADTDSPPPVAALSCLGDGGAPGDDWVLRVDPVHLHADRDRLRLFSCAVLDVQSSEAAELCRELNTHFARCGWMVEPLHAQRWYLSFESDPGLRGPTLWHVTDGDLRDAMPRGEYGAYWRALLNEIQMLFHASPVNQRREVTGQLPVNGAWIWGGGRLCDVGDACWALCVGSDPVLRGLAAAHGLPHREADDGLTEEVLQCSGSAIVLLPALEAGDGRWGERVEAIEACWLQPALHALSAGRLQELELFAGDGCAYRLDRRALRRFWKRPVPLIEFCTQGYGKRSPRDPV